MFSSYDHFLSQPHEVSWVEITSIYVSIFLLSHYTFKFEIAKLFDIFHIFAYCENYFYDL